MQLFILKILHKLHIITDIQFIRRRDIVIISNSRLFNKDWYWETYPDVEGMNPARHYLQYGWKEGRNPSADFNGNLYLAKYPDVANEGMCPLVHYERFGRQEGRFSGVTVKKEKPVQSMHRHNGICSVVKKIKYIFAYPIRLQKECDRLEDEIDALEIQLK